MQEETGIFLFTLAAHPLTCHLVFHTERSPYLPPSCDPLEPGKSVGPDWGRQGAKPPHHPPARSHRLKVRSLWPATCICKCPEFGFVRFTLTHSFDNAWPAKAAERILMILQVRDGMAGRFRGKKWAKKFGPKKALLSSRRAASLLYSLYKRWCKCCLAQWYIGVGRARLNKPIPTRPPLLPSLARAKDINQGRGESSEGVNTGIIPWRCIPIPPRPILPPALSHSASGVWPASDGLGLLWETPFGEKLGHSLCQCRLSMEDMTRNAKCPKLTENYCLNVFLYFPNKLSRYPCSTIYSVWHWMLTLLSVLVYLSFQVSQFSSRYCNSRGELCIARHYELCTHIWRSPTLRSCQQRPLESLVDPQTPLCCWCEGPHVQCTLYTVYYTAQVKVR